MNIKGLSREHALEAFKRRISALDDDALFGALGTSLEELQERERQTIVYTRPVVKKMAFSRSSLAFEACSIENLCA